MRILRTLLLLLFSLSMFACGEPSYLGKTGKLLTSADFWLVDSDAAQANPNNTTAAKITDAKEFAPSWNIDFDDTVNIYLSLYPSAPGPDPINIFSSQCGPTAGTSFPCELVDNFACLYDAAATTVTCTSTTGVAPETTFGPVDISALGPSGEMYLVFQACSSDTCAGTSTVKVTFN